MPNSFDRLACSRHEDRPVRERVVLRKDQAVSLPRGLARNRTFITSAQSRQVSHCVLSEEDAGSS